jgi:hypothetical protein
VLPIGESLGFDGGKTQLSNSLLTSAGSLVASPPSIDIENEGFDENVFA